MSELLVRSIGGHVALDVCGVRVSYGSGDALKGVTLSVSHGDMVGIIGPNGSGKSTLLKAITQVVRPQSGDVFVDGSNVNGLSRRGMAQSVSVVEQSTDVGFDFGVREVVAMGRMPHQGFMAGESVDDRKAVNTAMEATRVSEFQGRSIRDLSGGERQRVLLARALAQDTPLLLLDEPTSHLDIGNQIEVMDLVKGLCLDTGKTVVAVLHDLNLASQYCDWLVLMEGGKIYAMGPPSEVITEDNIWKVYSVRSSVAYSPLTGRPYVMAVSEEHRGGPARLGPSGMKVHVICGGGSGESVLRALQAHGIEVTAGVLNLLDSDEETCRGLGIPAVIEAPFSPISDERLEECSALAEACDAVVVCPVPFAAGNLRNLQVAVRARALGKAVIVLEHDSDEWDFVGGQAASAVDSLLRQGALSVGSVGDAMSIIKGIETHDD